MSNHVLSCLLYSAERAQLVEFWDGLALPEKQAVLNLKAEPGSEAVLRCMEMRCMERDSGALTTDQVPSHFPCVLQSASCTALACFCWAEMVSVCRNGLLVVRLPHACALLLVAAEEQAGASLF
jgi:hypothetical protein